MISLQAGSTLAEGLTSLMDCFTVGRLRLLAICHPIVLKSTVSGWVDPARLICRSRKAWMLQVIRSEICLLVTGHSSSGTMSKCRSCDGMVNAIGSRIHSTQP
jgi:hypothetical protein